MNWPLPGILLRMIMPQLQQVLAQIAELDPADQEAVFLALSKKGGAGSPFFPNDSQRLPSMQYSTIVRTPYVCGGDARVIRTRISVWVLHRMRQLGISEGDILKSYPTLRAVDLVQAWSYADNHRQEIDEAIQANEEIEEG
jgi:uncharacterized protein (DUF433 family)